MTDPTISPPAAPTPARHPHLIQWTAEDWAALSALASRLGCSRAEALRLALRAAIRWLDARAPAEGAPR